MFFCKFLIGTLFCYVIVDTRDDKLYQEVRILCWVMTAPKNLRKKAQHVKATWARRCNKLIFMSSETDESFPTVGLGIPEGRSYLWGKTKAAFQYVYDHHLNDADWFLKADDDTYVIVENMRAMLKNYDPSEAIYFGRKFKPYVSQGYMSGGAGYVLSKTALTRLIQKGFNGHQCQEGDKGIEDLYIGKCLERVKVPAGDSRDNDDKETFHPFVPEHHLIPTSYLLICGTGSTTIILPNRSVRPIYL